MQTRESAARCPQCPAGLRILLHAIISFHLFLCLFTAFKISIRFMLLVLLQLLQYEHARLVATVATVASVLTTSHRRVVPSIYRKFTAFSIRSIIRDWAIAWVLWTGVTYVCSLSVPITQAWFRQYHNSVSWFIVDIKLSTILPNSL